MHPALLRTFALQRLWPILLLGSFLLLALNALPRARAQTLPPQEPERVLLLHSYHPGLRWTDAITDSINRALEHRPSCEVVTIYLDAKRFPLEDVDDAIIQLVSQRHATRPIDVVITTDNAALDWANTQLPELLPDVPVVFCGVNHYDPKMHDCLPEVTGARENLDIRGTFAAMQQLQPDLKRCIVVCDDTAFGSQSLEEIGGILGATRDGIRIEYWSHADLQSLQTRLKLLDPRTDGVFLGVFTRGSEGRYLDYEEAAGKITGVSAAPVYSVWDFYLNQGIAGGSIISACEQGRHAAVAAAKVLDGIPANTIPIQTETPVLWFDESVLRQRGMDLSRIPEQARLLNQPHNWFEDHREQVAWVFFFMLLEALAFLGAVVLWARARRRHKAQRQRFATQIPGLLFEYTYSIANDSIKVAYISGGSKQIFGVNPEDICKDTVHVFNAIHPDDRELVRRSIRDGSRMLEVRRQRYRTCPRPGETRWVENFATPELRRSGHVRWYGFIADITDSVETQQSLQALHDRFEVAADAAKFGIWDLEFPGNHLRWDDRMFEIYGATREDFHHNFQDWAGRVHTDDLSQVTGAFEQATGEGNRFEYEFRIHRPDGEERIIKAHGRVCLDASSNSRRIIGLNYDITEERRAEREMRVLASIVENSRDFIVVKDLDRCIVATNDAFASATGRGDVSELLGQTDEEILAPGADAATLRQLREDDQAAQALPPGQSLVREETLDLPGCGRLHLLTRKFPIFDARAKLIGTGSISADISPLVARSEEIESTNEQLQEAIAQANQMAVQAGAADEAKSAFLATMSHEIRTPLNSIVGLAEVLTGTPLNPEQQDYLRTIRTSSDILLTLINDILDYSKMEAGRLHLERIPFGLAGVIDDSLQILAPRAQKNGVRLAVEVAPDTPGRLLGDPTRLRQILLNLLSNALKFTEQGEVRLCVAGRSPDRQHAELTIRVSDTGIGMTPEVCERLFKPFQQGDDSVTRRFGGTGLGLVISKRLAEQMDGSIDVQSASGQGSTFIVQLRLPRDAHCVPFFNVHDTAPFRGKRIHICADDERDAAHFAGLVKAWGANATITLLEASAASLALPSPTEADACLLHGATSQVIERNLAQSTATAPLLWISSPATSGATNVLPGRRGMSTSGPVALGFVHQLLKKLLAGQTDCLNNPEPHASFATSTNGDAPLATTIPLRILAAEDNPVNQKVLRVILKTFGYDLTCVENGLQAVEAVQREPFDLVLMDIQMPVMDGFTAATNIHHLRPNLPRIPHIVALTASAPEYNRENCMRAGLSDYLTKPVRPVDLQDCIQKIFGEEPTPLPTLPANDEALLEGS